MRDVPVPVGGVRSPFVLFEMLTGRLPFEGETVLSVAVKQKSEAPPDPRSLNPQIPDGLDRLARPARRRNPLVL